MSSLAQELVEITEQGVAAVLATVVEVDGTSSGFGKSRVVAAPAVEAHIPDHETTERANGGQDLGNRH